MNTGGISYHSIRIEDKGIYIIQINFESLKVFHNFPIRIELLFHSRTIYFLIYYHILYLVSHH